MVQKICPNCLEPSPIACKRCRKCDHEFKKRTESEPVAVVKKVPRKALLSASGKANSVRTIRTPPILPVITPEEKERALFREVTIVNKKCTYCSAPSPIACKKCRNCGGEFKRKGYIGSNSTEPPLGKKPKRTCPIQREVESPEPPIQKLRSKIRLDSVGTDADQEERLRELYIERKERLSYILQGINDKLTRTTKIHGGIIKKN